MEQKQHRKRGLKGLASGRSKGQIELSEKTPEQETPPVNQSYKQLTSPHSKTQKLLNSYPDVVGHNGVSNGGTGENGVNDTIDNILRTPQGVHVDFETASNLSTHEGKHRLHQLSFIHAFKRCFEIWTKKFWNSQLLAAPLLLSWSRGPVNLPGTSILKLVLWDYNQLCACRDQGNSW